MRPEYTAVFPEFGLADGCAIEPPRPGFPLWLTAVALPPQENAHGSFSAAMVGAAGLTRANSWVRGVGEAVERYGLRPSPGPPEADVSGADVTAELVDAGLLGPDAEPGEMLAGLRLDTGTPCAVPMSAIDYPAPGSTVGVDSTPSGAASGLDPDRAHFRACLELVERDAFERAWQGGSTPRRVSLEALEKTVSPAERADLTAVRHLAEDCRFSITLGLLETVAGIPAVTALVQRSGGPVGVGCAAGASFASCAVKAVVEGVQVESLLRNWGAQEPRTSGDEDPDWSPATEEERLSYLCSETATDAATAFGDSFEWSFLPDVEPAPSSWAGLAERLAPMGVHCYSVDLTTRLPAGVRTLGWHAVRVLAPGLQPLRGNDQLTWNWSPRRMEGLVSPAGRSSRPPHPLA